ncbi:MAG: hypothetical protein C4519_03095 [Desulfobacteraceae bacterium]|nr:MAG: hypothetical protein C4519_03095 [Desulfobacteraceae bacterium]
MDRHPSLSNGSHPIPFLALGLTFAALALFMLPGFASAATIPAVKTDSTWFVDMNRFASSAHATFNCADCHAAMLENNRAHPNPADPGFLKTPAIQSYDYGRCQKCHKESYDRYVTGGHARARASIASGAVATPAVSPAPGYAAPTCGACHTSHYVRSGLSRAETGRRMLAVCGQCHPAHKASYLDNIHGQLAVNLDNTAAAFCTDCHGAHKVESLKEPEVALAACRRCHPKAQPEFANIVMHAAAEHLSASEAPKSPALRWIERVRLAAIGAVALALVFFLGHSFLWLVREIHEKLRKP